VTYFRLVKKLCKIWNWLTNCNLRNTSHSWKNIFRRFEPDNFKLSCKNVNHRDKNCVLDYNAESWTTMLKQLYRIIVRNMNYIRREAPKFFQVYIFSANHQKIFLKEEVFILKNSVQKNQFARVGYLREFLSNLDASRLHF